MKKIGDDLLKEYLKENKLLCNNRSKIACLLGIALVPIFGFLDKSIIPSMFIFFMKMRVGISLFVAILLLLHFKKFGKKHPEILGILFFSSVGIMIAYMTRYLGGYKSTYYAGLNLLFLAMGVLMPWRLIYTVISFFIIYGFYLVPVILFDKIDDVPILLNNNFFIFATIIIAITSNFFTYRLRLQEFLSRYNLAEAYGKLKGLDDLKTQFFSNVSHELRTPLTMILAPSESILKGEAGNITKKVYNFVETIHSNTLRLLKLINDLLDFSRIEAGKMSVNFEKLELDEFIKGIIAEVSHVAKKKNLSLRFMKKGDIPPFYFDPDKIEKVLLNIIYNSIKFTDEGGKITISSFRKNNSAVVKITDTGIGIEKKDIEKIFDRFVQLDGSHKRRYAGTGIGLPLAKELVELHKGTIKVDSEVGKGTTTIFTLPLVLEYKEELKKDISKGVDWTKRKHREAVYSGTDIIRDSGKETVDTETPSLSGGKKVLVVEDNVDMLNFVAFQLEREYRVFKAHNGKEGLETAQKEVPDLIIADIMMPVMDGHELCQKVKENEKTKHIPVIFLTAKAGSKMKIEGYEKGADEYLVKPFNAQELRARVKSLLNLSKLEREIQERSEVLEKTLKELKETQAQLVHSEKMASLGQLVAGIAHEMNNPIAASLSSSNAVLKHIERSKRGEENLNDEKVREDLEETIQFLRHGLDRTTNIIADLKVFSKKDVAGMKEVNIHEGLDSTLNILRGSIRDSNIAIHKNYGYPGKVECSLGLMNQVFMNVFQNSIDAIKDKGQIWITTQREGDNVKILIKDNGHGVKKDNLPKVFDPFFTTKDVGEGIGLGLSISYSIMREHKGTISINGEEGQGTEVSIVLPIQQREVIKR